MALSELILSLFISFFLSVLLVPPVSRLAVRVGGVDLPAERRVHDRAVPRLGGVAIVCAFLFTTMLLVEMDRAVRGVLIGGLFTFSVGLIDDLAGLPPRHKFLGQLAAVTFAVLYGGVHLSSLGNLFGIPVTLGPLAIPFTVIAVVGVTNAINLSDGLDGLAAGISIIGLLPMGILAFRAENYHLVALIAVLIGATAGFIRYNTHPATIFMGDSGSLFLGFCLGMISVQLVVEGEGRVSPLSPLLILSVPIVDTLMVMVRRRMEGKSIAAPDKTHFHHHLLNLLASHRLSVQIIYGVCYLVALCAILMQGKSDEAHLSVFCVVVIAMYGGLHLARRAEGRRVGPPGGVIALRERIVVYARRLRIVIKSLLALILTLPLGIVPILPVEAAWGAMGAGIGMLFLCRLEAGRWWAQWLMNIISLSAIVAVDHYGRMIYLGEFPFVFLSHGLFALLFILVAVKTLLRNRYDELMVDPFEYFLFFLLIGVTLLPAEISIRFHLVSAVAKSVLFLWALRLVREKSGAIDPRLVRVAAGVALLFVVMRVLLP